MEGPFIVEWVLLTVETGVLSRRGNGLGVVPEAPGDTRRGGGEVEVGAGVGT